MREARSVFSQAMPIMRMSWCENNHNKFPPLFLKSFVTLCRNTDWRRDQRQSQNDRQQRPEKRRTARLSCTHVQLGSIAGAKVFALLSARSWRRSPVSVRPSVIHWRVQHVDESREFEIEINKKNKNRTREKNVKWKWKKPEATPPTAAARKNTQPPGKK